MATSEILLSSLASQNLPWEHEYTPIFAQPAERYQQGDIVLQLLLAARIALAQAVSYRRFDVAASATAIAPDGRVGRFLGYNVKVDPSDTVNIHAEDLVREKARRRGYGKIATLVVVGEPQRDTQSGKESATLHPCGRCRDRMQDDPLIDKNALIVTSTPEMQTIEFGGLDDYIASQQQGITTLHSAHFPERLDHFQPLLEAGTHVVIGEESIDQRHEDEWNRKVVFPLLHRSRWIDAQ